MAASVVSCSRLLRWWQKAAGGSKRGLTLSKPTRRSIKRGSKNDSHSFKVSFMGDAVGLIIAVLALYFLPTIIAVGRSHHQAAAVAVLNFFLGWTFLGWVAALVWSSSAVQLRALPSVPHTAPPLRQNRPSHGSKANRIAAGIASLAVAIVAIGLVFIAINERSSPIASRPTSTTAALPSQLITASIPARKAGKVTDLAIKEVRPSLSGNVLMIEAATLENAGAGTARDIRITCETFGRSGTRISSVSKVLYDVLLPGKRTAIRRVNMGFVDDQSKSGQCEVTSAKFD